MTLRMTGKFGLAVPLHLERGELEGRATPRRMKVDGMLVEVAFAPAIIGFWIKTGAPFPLSRFPG
jgi:hypothetical protein